MADYRVALTSSAEKELKKLPGQLVGRTVSRLDNLASNPCPSGCKKLKGGDHEWRIRVGNYRVVYTRPCIEQTADKDTRDGFCQEAEPCMARYLFGL